MTTRVKISWKGKQFTDELRKAAMQGAEDAAKQLSNLCKATVSTPYPPASVKGEPPHKRIGTGQEAIIWISLPNRLESYVVVMEEGRHMIYLEIGTRFIEPRPWLRPTFQDNKDLLRATTMAPLQKVFR